MTVLEYGSGGRRRSTWWRPLAIAAVGGLVGIGAGAIAYDALLNLLSRGTHLYDTGGSGMADRFVVFVKFVAACCGGGVLVGYGSWLKGLTGRFFRELTMFVGLIVAGGIGGFAYAYSTWNPVGHFATRLIDAPMLPAPLAGCVLASLAIGLSVARRVAAPRSVA